jgi:hypothetical protein
MDEELALKNLSTSAGIATQVEKEQFKVTNRERLNQWVVERIHTGDEHVLDMFSQSVLKSWIKAYIEENDGDIPDGVEPVNWVEVQIKAPAGANRRMK